MREIIDQFLKGKFEYTEKKLDFSTPRVELSLGTGETIEGTFTVFGPEGRLTEGRIISSDVRMDVLTPEFSGSPFEASYRFNAIGLTPGDVLQGEFRIISNQGEYLLPFVVTVRLDHIASSLGDIKNLFHFANLAKTDWAEAVNLFYSSDFITIFKGNDGQYESLYRGLSQIPGSEQNVEEFLISINKKQPVTYIPDQQEILLDFTGLSHDTTFILSRNGWGYTQLTAKVDGEFISLDKYQIGEEDFSGSSCRVRLRLKTDKLHSGNNFGCITFENAYVSVKVPVTVSVDFTGSHFRSDYHEKKKLILELIRVYENFSCKKITSRAWVSETGKIISKMNALDEKDLEFRLYTAHYYITAGRVNEGKWILDHAEREVEEAPGDTLYCYFLYLSTLCSREEAYINDIAERMEGIFRRNPDNWRIAWLLQFVSEEYSSSTPRKWMMLEQQFSFGSRSPIIYMEAMNLLNETPPILTNLDEYELYVLMYGARRKIISLNLMDQIVYLSMRVRNFDKKLFTVLKACYEIKESDEVLEAIVSLLIKGGKTDRDSFAWYAKGVERELHITRLYEYYMMSIYTDQEGNLPCEISRMILMYFSYQSDLEYDKNAILYKYVHENREDFPELYESFRPQIEKFMLAQLDKGRISRELGYLYKNLLTKQMVDAANASKVLSVLYTAEIRTEDKRISEVLVVYDKCEREMRYPLTDGVAFVPLYGSDYAILLADRQENRYAASVPYSSIRLMAPGRVASYAIPYIQKGKENLDLFLCDLGKNAYTINMENVGRYKDLAASELVRKSCRDEIRNNLVRFYYDNDFTRQLTEYLMEIDPSGLQTKDRNDILELMVMGGLYDRALEWLKCYGTYGVDPKVVLRLCGRLIDRDAFDGFWPETEIAFYAFSASKYDEQLLKYLVANYNGTVKGMRNIWKAAESFGIDTYPLSERILVQMMYSGSYVGEKNLIYQSYVQSGANTDIEMAFLASNCYENFVHGKITDKYLFERIEKLAQEKLPLDEVCKLSYLRHYASEKKADEEFNPEVVISFLRELLAEGIFFPFFMDYAELCPDMYQFSDKTMIEYRTTPGSVCMLHYRLAGSDDNKYHSLEMKEMYDGIYVCSFVLFFGEQLQYYVSEERGEQGPVTTESAVVSKNDIVKTGSGSRYSLINDIMIGETLQDYDTVDKLMQEYFKKKSLCDHLFKPLKEDE